MNEINNEFVRRMKQVKRIMQDNKEKHGHDQMALTIDDFITMVDMLDQADNERHFMVIVEGERQTMIVTVREREDRPKHIDAHTVLEQWMTTEYNSRKYDYWEVSDVAKMVVI